MTVIALVDGGMADTVLEWITAVCMIGGALMSVAAGIGLLRFPDLFSRMHAATKPQVLGLFLLLLSVALQIRAWVAVPVLLLAWLFQLLTAPVTAHMVGRAAYRTKHLKQEKLVLDDLNEVVSEAQRRLDEGR